MNTYDKLIEFEAMADLMIQKGQEMKIFATKQRKKLEGVSTPSNARKGLTVTQVAQLQNKMQIKFNKKINA